LSASAITVQAALLYTSAEGERRIRVHTMLIPVTHNSQEMLNSLDIDTAVNIISKQAVDIAQKEGIEVARRRVHENTADIIRAAKTAGVTGGNASVYGAYGAPPGTMPNGPGATGVELPATLNFLPLYSMSLMKNVVLRGGTDVRLDERAFFQMMVQNMDVEDTILFIYPRMFSIADMDDGAGRPCDNVDDDQKVAGTAEPICGHPS
jgi:protein transport protein SEC24